MFVDRRDPLETRECFRHGRDSTSRYFNERSTPPNARAVYIVVSEHRASHTGTSTFTQTRGRSLSLYKFFSDFPDGLDPTIFKAGALSGQAKAGALGPGRAGPEQPYLGPA